MAIRQTFRPAPRRAAAGFTLIEVMIVAVIIAVLAAVAYPAYLDSVVTARRSAAKTCLLETAQFLERFYTTNLRYDQTLAGTAVALPACSAGTDVTSFYNVGFNGAVGQRTFTLRAVPQGGQATRDTKCATLGVNNLGVRTKTGTDTVDYCW